MKATLTFNLPEENQEHLLAVKAPALAAAVMEAAFAMRAWSKHGHGFKTSDEVLDACRDILFAAETIARNEHP